MYCTASFLMTTKRRLPLEGKPLNFTIMWSREHYIADHMMRSSFAACHKRRHTKCLKKHITACVKLISLARTWGSTPKTGVLLAKDDPWRHRLRQAMSCLSNPQWLHPPGIRTSPPYNFFLAIWDMGNGRDWPHKPTFIQSTLVHPSHNRLLL